MHTDGDVKWMEINRDHLIAQQQILREVNRDLQSDQHHPATEKWRLRLAKIDSQIAEYNARIPT